MEGIPGGPVVRTLLPRAGVLSLAGELRSHMPRGMAPPPKKKMWGEKEAEEINLNYIFEPNVSQMLSF